LALATPDPQRRPLPHAIPAVADSPQAGEPRHGGHLPPGGTAPWGAGVPGWRWTTGRLLHRPYNDGAREEAADPSELDTLPERASPWYESRDDRSSRELREDAAAEILDVLARVIATSTTPRQREILRLYYLEDTGEARIAAKLGISQPTVSQHLTGKLRGGRKVGGALQRLRKGLKRAAAATDVSTRERQVAVGA